MRTFGFHLEKKKDGRKRKRRVQRDGEPGSRSGGALGEGQTWAKTERRTERWRREKGEKQLATHASWK